MRWPMRRARCSKSDRCPRMSNIRARCSSRMSELCMLPPTSSATSEPASSPFCSASASAPFEPASIACAPWQLQVSSPGQGISSTIQSGVSSSRVRVGLQASRWVSTRVCSKIDRSSMDGSSTIMQGGKSSSGPSFCKASGAFPLTSRLHPTPGSTMVASRACLYFIKISNYIYLNCHSGCENGVFLVFIYVFFMNYLYSMNILFSIQCYMC
jgi:hypothetical protein